MCVTKNYPLTDKGDKIYIEFKTNNSDMVDKGEGGATGVQGDVTHVVTNGLWNKTIIRVQTKRIKIL